jgi:hypothetical protein
MNRHRWLAALFLILALGGCAPLAPGQGPDCPYSHDSGAEVRGM